MYIFRADGNKDIGAGHVMRCLTVADELRKLGTDPVFVCADTEPEKMITDRGYEVICLNSDYRQMEGEVPSLAKVIKARAEDHTAKADDFTARIGEPTVKNEDLTEEAEDPADITLVIDSYFITDGYLNALRHMGIRTVVIDDLCEKRIPADVVINYNAYADGDKYRKLYSDSSVEDGKTALYLGSRLIPVREMFLNRGYKVRKKVENVLITTGGSDISGIGCRILESLISDTSVTFHVIAGRFNPYIDRLKELASAHDNVLVYDHVEDMAGLFLKCDIAITAGGSTTYELCAIGLPFICFSYADNQEQVVEYMDDHGIASDAGAYHRAGDLVIHNIRNIYDRYRAYYDIRKSHSDMGLRLVDGKGAGRMARIIYER
jgi:UDP-2,4-diacetamido-2,4,6-trideoxy-beta-L-altropyranose hydrolase